MPDRERALSLERRLRTAGLLIVLGLLVQLIASMWTIRWLSWPTSSSPVPWWQPGSFYISTP